MTAQRPIRPTTFQPLLALVLIAAFLLSAFPAHADSGFINRVGSVFDSIARGLNLVGRKSEDILSPKIGVPPAAVRADFSGLVQETREFRESYPVMRNATLSIINTFGETRIDTWDSQVVRVVAHITVGAPSEDIASDVAGRIDVGVTHSDDLVRLESILPDTRALGRVPIQIDYFITVPRDTSVMSDNTFGDTYVYGVAGAVTVDSRFGAVNLQNIGGAVNVRAKGQFPVSVQDIKQGGFFELSDSTATLARIDGAVEVRSYLGTVDLRELGPEAQVDAACDSGTINLYLSEADQPDLTATSVFGEIQSDVDLTRTARGEAVLARSPQAEAKVRVSLHTSFGQIAIHREGKPMVQVQPSATAKDELVKQGPQEDVVRIGNGMALSVDATVGDVRIEGTDDEEVHVSATRLARVTAPERARAALKALTVTSVPDGNTLRVTTSANEDMATFGCTAYRIDLVIRAPRTMPVTVRAQNGHITITDMGEAVKVVQAEGSLALEHVKGTLDLRNSRGDIQVVDCAGPATVNASYGTVLARNVFGAIDAQCVEGKIVVDSPKGPVTAHCRGGDIRILALEGIGGDYDVFAENGSLSIVLPPNADATLMVSTENGAINSTVPLTGTIEGGEQKFMGQLSSGAHQVILGTKGGDLSIN